MSERCYGNGEAWGGHRDIQIRDGVEGTLGSTGQIPEPISQDS